MPSSRQARSKPSAVKQLPRSVSTRVTRNGKAASASRRNAVALAPVSSSLTARWTERERRSMATNRNRLRSSPSAVRIGGPQLRQVLHVHVDEAELVPPELRRGPLGRGGGRPAAQ